jgi:mRNA-degrading endonuclease RelE of RelBE toxin-antitoxin system
MAVKLIYTTSALKALRKVPGKDAAALMATLAEIAAEPFTPHPRARKLTDHPGFRSRQGDWRAVYRIDRATEEMIVETVGHRSEVYK